LNGCNPMRLVDEDKNGAYLGVREEFLKSFTRKESNPNFEVYDSRDNYRRFVVAKCSRLPDDEDLAAGKYGINFHRAKPGLPEAQQYKAGLPAILFKSKKLNDLAFAAATEHEYKAKSAAWDRFYSYIWDTAPLTLWVTPHSGGIDRKPDDIFPYPQLEMDAFIAGTAALCAFKDSNKATRRVMISLHSHNWFGAALDLGSFGILDERRLNSVAAKIEKKYHEKVQEAAGECKKDFSLRAANWLERINGNRGTLHPLELKPLSNIDSNIVLNIMKGMELYGIQIKEFTPEEFKVAINSINKEEIQVASCNFLFPGKHIGQLLGLAEKIEKGLLSSAVQIECSKIYLAKAPDLMSDIILDIKNELFG
jgi:hypothetical protein